mmetsp:Transcript_4428/g.9363  ORF Transcript_4428/g.9363 Transcript_4428/m.9363 type:complete len:159 (-) Transcript_4428:263-739(-)
MRVIKLTLLILPFAFSSLPDCHPEYNENFYVELKSQEHILRGEALCVNGWTFGIPEDTGEVVLFQGDQAKWIATDIHGNVVEGCDFLNMNKGGTLACYEGTPGNPTSSALWAKGCPGNTKNAFVRFDRRWWPIVRLMKQGNTLWSVSQQGVEDHPCEL